MPTPAPSEPIQKVTLNLFTKDIEWAKAHWGRGWTGEIRALLRNHRWRLENVNPRRTDD